MAVTKAPKIKVKPVDKNTWKDFEAFFESKGAPGWRVNGPAPVRRNVMARKA